VVVAGLALLFLIISLYEIPYMIKEKLWKELIVFSGLMLIAAALSFGYVLDFPLPSPTRLIERALNPLTTWVERITF